MPLCVATAPPWRPGPLSMPGYSNCIGHALAFAAKYHDHAVRRGSAAPYMTAPPSVAIILTRYGQDDDTVVAGILHAAVEGWARGGSAADPFDRRVAEKFGPEVTRAALESAERRYDDDGVEMSAEERREELLARLGSAGERARWVVAAEAVHACGTLLADLGRTAFPELVWARVPPGREAAVHRYRRLVARLEEVGFTAPIVEELREMLAGLERTGPATAAALRGR